MSNRTIKLFAMHGRLDGGILDYREFFEWVGSRRGGETRVAVWDDLVFVLEASQHIGQKLALHFISGDPLEQPLTYNDATGQLDVDTSDEETWPARRTRVIVDPDTRLVAVESRHTGVSPKNLEKYFAVLAREGNFGGSLSLELSPVQSDTFERELDEFTRIREATVVLRRPNFDWDDVEDDLTDLASSSNGSRATTTINAARGQSLATDQGIVGIIREHANRTLGSIVRAVVTGNKRGQAGEVQLSTDQHQKRRSIRIRKSDSERVVREAVVDAAVQLLADAQDD